MSSLKKYEAALKEVSLMIGQQIEITAPIFEQIVENNNLDEEEAVELKKLRRMFLKKISEQNQKPGKAEREEIIKEMLYPKEKEKPELAENKLDIALEKLKKFEVAVAKQPKTIFSIATECELNEEEEKSLRLFAKNLQEIEVSRKEGSIEEAFQELENFFLDNDTSKINTKLIESIAERNHISAQELKKLFKVNLKKLTEKRSQLHIRDA